MSVVSFHPNVPHRFAVVQVKNTARFAYIGALTRDEKNQLIGYYARLVDAKGEVAERSIFVKPEQIRNLWSQVPTDAQIQAELCKDWGEIQ